MRKEERNKHKENEIREIKKELKEIKTLLQEKKLREKIKLKNSLRTAKTPFLLTFTDLIYSVVIGIGLSFIPSLVNTQNLLSIILLSFVFLLIFDDWYGEHFYGMEPLPGNLWFFGDVAVFFIFFFYEYLSAMCSIFLLLAMALNGMRGIILDYFFLRESPRESLKHHLAKISLGYAIAFTAIYLSFSMIIFYYRIYYFNKVLISIMIGLWASLRLIEDILKRRANKLYRKK